MCHEGQDLVYRSRADSWSLNKTSSRHETVLHRDLKPGNGKVNLTRSLSTDISSVLLNWNQDSVIPIVKIADFGHAIICDAEHAPSTTQKGTGCYKAPVPERSTLSQVTSLLIDA